MVEKNGEESDAIAYRPNSSNLWISGHGGQASCINDANEEMLERREARGRKEGKYCHETRILEK